MEDNWQQTLAKSYKRPGYHIGMMTAVGRRIRRNYLCILLIQSAADVGKLTVHPTPVQNLDQLFSRADVGPIPVEALVLFGPAYMQCWAGNPI